MHFGRLEKNDIANGPGVRVSIWVSGCTLKCPGCFNTKSHDFNYGEEFTQDTIDEVLESLKPDYIKGLTILGGEPLMIQNQESVMNLILSVREVYGLSKDIILFSGFTMDNIKSESQKNKNSILNCILRNCDFMVTGPYLIHEQVLDQFRGSANQEYWMNDKGDWKLINKL